MAKSTSLMFTQNVNNIFAMFTSADELAVITAAPNSNGTNLTTGTRTFTAAAGTVKTGGAAASWTAVVADTRVVGVPIMTAVGNYLVTPTASANAATVDSGSSNATWNLTVETLKLLYTGSTNDCIVKALQVSSTDSAARVVSLWLTDTTSGQYQLICSTNVPLTSGSTGSIAAVDLLGGTLNVALPFDANGKRVIPLKTGYKLYASVPAVTAAKSIWVTGMVEEY